MRPDQFPDGSRKPLPPEPTLTNGKTVERDLADRRIVESFHEKLERQAAERAAADPATPKRPRYVYEKAARSIGGRQMRPSGPGRADGPTR